MSYHQTVEACVFQGHAAGHDCRECPLVQVLVRRVRNLGIEDSPAHVDRELDKYRALARVLNFQMPALWRSIVTSRISWSPGSTGRLKRAPSMPTK